MEIKELTVGKSAQAFAAIIVGEPDAVSLPIAKMKLDEKIKTALNENWLLILGTQIKRDHSGTI